MILDDKLQFCDAQSPTVTNAAETDSTNVLDLGANGNDVGKLLRWFVLNELLATSAGASTLTIAWHTSSAAATGFAAIYTSSAIALASLTAGAMLINGAVLPEGIKRYNKLVFTVGGADFTVAPKLTAYIVANDMPVSRIST